MKTSKTTYGETKCRKHQKLNMEIWRSVKMKYGKAGNMKSRKRKN